MPKENQSVYIGKSRASPYRCSISHSSRLESEEKVKEWEEARCPVCMEHPHNAILLLCSSHQKGCRPYMCDTSHRHSNCFDQFQKSMGASVAQPDESLVATTPTMMSKLVCPLCRGRVSGWTVVEAARQFMNSKSRSCANETCEFSGTCMDLRKHARLVHPKVRPSEADPERLRNWRRLERERVLGDFMSRLQSSIREMRVEVGRLSSGFRPTSRVRAQATTRIWGESYDSESRANDDYDDGFLDRYLGQISTRMEPR